MVTKDNLVYVDDIRVAIIKIEQYVGEISFEEFKADSMCQDAVIRNLEVIGEAANKISTEFADSHPILPVRQAIDMRNFLIHGYDQIDLAAVWKTVAENLPPLKEAVAKILS